MTTNEQAPTFRIDEQVMKLSPTELEKSNNLLQVILLQNRQFGPIPEVSDILSALVRIG